MVHQVEDGVSDENGGDLTHGEVNLPDGGSDDALRSSGPAMAELGYRGPTACAAAGMTPRGAGGASPGGPGEGTQGAGAAERRGASKRPGRVG